MEQIASQNAPSVKLVIPHFILGGVAWVLVTMLITLTPDSFTQHYFNPQLLAITHLLVLGCLTMVIFGALYQLIPVVLEVKLYSEKMAFISLSTLVVGTALLVLSFWNFWLGKLLLLAAILLLSSVIVFGINVLLSIKKSQKETIEKQFIQNSVLWLIFTVFAGGTLAINLTQMFLTPPHIELLKLHANAGMVGWFLQLIIGVSSKLLPMFMVSHNVNKRKLKKAFVLINSGLVFSLMSIYLQWHYVTVLMVFIIVIGVAFFLSYLIEAYNKRIKKHLDIGMQQSAISIVMLAVSLVLIVVLLVFTEVFLTITLPMSIAFGSTLLIGFVTSLVMGQTYKTLPFIVWLHVYRNKMQKSEIPLPKELYNEKIAWLQTWSFAFGFMLFFAGILIKTSGLIRGGGIIMFVSAILYLFNSLKIVLHKAK